MHRNIHGNGAVQGYDRNMTDKVGGGRRSGSQSRVGSSGGNGGGIYGVGGEGGGGDSGEGGGGGGGGSGGGVVAAVLYDRFAVRLNKHKCEKVTSYHVHHTRVRTLIPIPYVSYHIPGDEHTTRTLALCLHSYEHKVSPTRH